MMKRMAPFVLVILLFACGTPTDDQAECTRDVLNSLVDQYIASLTAHDSSSLPLAPNARFTENGVEKAVGTGFWETAGKELHKITLIDTQECGAHIQAVMEEPFSSTTVGPAAKGGMTMGEPKPRPEEGTIRPILFAARLKVEEGTITEIETIVARENEFAMEMEIGGKPGGAPGVLLTKDQDWSSILPPEKRTARNVMIEAADHYFDMFAEAPTVSVPFAKVCDRWENGVQTTQGGSFAGGPEMAAHDCSPTGLVISNHGPRRFLVDEEKGLVVAYVHFAGSLPDCHIFRMREGEVDLIQAVIGAGSQTMGWPDEPAEQP